MAMHTTPLVIRPVCADDIPAVVRLATLLDTMNLPRDPEMIASIVAESTASFARLTDSLLQPGILPARGTYMLVAMQGEHVLGTASLLSHHGTPEDPHYYLRVVEQTFRSTQLQTERHRHLLRLQHDDIPRREGMAWGSCW
jgi:arginine/ornithine N-succinyltransferase beta subunit